MSLATGCLTAASCALGRQGRNQCGAAAPGRKERGIAANRLITVVGWAWSLVASAGEPLVVRVETLTVPPSTQPLVHVVARNPGAQVYRGEIALAGPAGWRLRPDRREVAIEPGQTARVPFTIEQGRNVEANRYAFEVTATAAGARLVHRQDVFVASAPYFRPKIDGRDDDWKDAIPITFSVGGKRTTVSAYWNRRQLALLVSVQEDRLRPYTGAPAASPCDAVQVAIAPLESPASERRAGRYEFLLASAGDAARCFRLAEPETEQAATQEPRPLEPLAFGDAELAVRREGDITHYECALPVRALRGAVDPAEGREFFLSVLVHDPDGTGLRDLGTAAGVWATAHDAMSWSRWPGAVWGNQPPRSHRVRWGLCTSKY